MNRRGLILGAVVATGALVVGWGVMPARSRLGSPKNMLPTEGDVALNGWIKVRPDGQICLAMHRSEMGQGVHTALSMLAAEELDVPLSHIHLEQAGYDAIYGNVAMFVGSLPFHPKLSEEGEKPVMVRSSEWVVSKIARELGINATGGSSTMADAWQPIREAAAAARASLLLAAAKQWQVPVDELQIKSGVIRHATGKLGHYGEFVQAASAMAPDRIVLKAPNDWALIGQSPTRVDLFPKINGSAVFGIDVRQPGLLYASVVQSPFVGGHLSEVDAQHALAMAGVVKFVRLETNIAGSVDGFAVVAKTTWHANQAARAVQAQWRQPEQGAIDTKRIATDLLHKLETEVGFTFYDVGDVSKAESSAQRLKQATYSAPYLAHATMEPMNCTAQLKDGQLDIWAPTQVPGQARAAAARVAGIDPDRVTVHVTLLGGGFGRRLEVDVVTQATQVAMACEGSPVQVIWSREEDMSHDFYRPMHVARLQASIDSKNQVHSLRIKSAGDAITPRWMARTLPKLSGPIDTPDKTTSEGLFDLPYAFAHQHMSHVATHMGVPVGFWRSVGHSHNAFFSESFMDELAFETQTDPLAYREALLSNSPKHLAVLKLAAEKANWGKALPPGHARGVALHESFGSIVAQVVEVSLHDGHLNVHRVVCAIDCGTVIHPNIVAQQVESSVIFALSAALFGQIDIHNGVVQQRNFNNYRMVQMKQAPTIETWIVPSTRPPAGVGEPAVPPLAPAVSNAMFVLTGVRKRALPLMDMPSVI